MNKDAYWNMRLVFLIAADLGAAWCAHHGGLDLHVALAISLWVALVMPYRPSVEQEGT